MTACRLQAGDQFENLVIRQLDIRHAVQARCCFKTTNKRTSHLITEFSAARHPPSVARVALDDLSPSISYETCRRHHCERFHQHQILMGNSEGRLFGGGDGSCCWVEIHHRRNLFRFQIPVVVRACDRPQAA